MSQTMLIICARATDFVWEAGATVARYTNENHAAHVLVLGDANALLREEAGRAATVLGVASLRFAGYDDAPLVMDAQRCKELARTIREIRPDFILTHAREHDLARPNNRSVADAVRCAYAIASAAGASCGGLPVAPRRTPLFGFEPQNPETAGWRPGVMIDATPFWAVKEQAMAALESEKDRLPVAVERALMRGVHCTGRGGKDGARYAEAFSAYEPIYAHGWFVW